MSSTAPDQAASLLLLVAGLLAMLLTLAAWALLVEARKSRLATRLERVLPDAAPAAENAAGIAIVADRPSRVLTLLRRVVRPPLDLPGANVLSPLAVGLIAMLAGALVAFATQIYLSVEAGVPGGILVGLALARGIFNWETRRYVARLQLQLPDAIEIIVSATRAGLPMLEAFRSVSREMPAPTGDEFARVVSEMALGTTAADALAAINRRTGLREYAIFAVTIGVQSRSGGRLAETIQKLAETVRTRLAINSRATALAGEAKVSAIILTALPFIAGLGLSVVRPGYLDPLFEKPQGQRLLTYAGLGIVLGILAMRQLILSAVKE
jgi:tight adherence protein B